MRTLSFLSLLVILIGCTPEVPKELESALDLAGENAKELKKVLRHYRSPKDSLKFQAAVFLIKNMEGKRAINDRRYERVQKLIASYNLSSINDFEAFKEKREELYIKVKKYDDISFTKVNDLKSISSKALITNIDHAFQAWEEMPWSGTNVSFEIFCRYVLPYRINSEPFIPKWREQVWQDYGVLIDSLKNANASMQAVAIVVNKRIGERYESHSKANYRHTFSYSDLKNISAGSCIHASSYALFILRALGIPSSFENVPFFGNRSSDHAWVAIHTTDSTLVPFDPAYEFKYFYRRFIPEVDKFHFPPATSIFLKVYRNTYENYDYSQPWRGLLGLTRNMVDVTSQYCPVSEIKYPTDNFAPEDGDIGVLLCFKSGKWSPVSISSSVNDKECVYDNMARKIVYLPTIYRGKTIIPIGSPFILDSLGNMNELSPQLDKMEKVILTRKFPYSVRLASFAERVKGGSFQLSNKKDFSDSKTVYTITSRPTPYLHPVKVKSDTKYKYFRYCAPDSSYGCIAELEVYTVNQKAPIYGTPIGIDGYNDKHMPIAAFDKNKLTYFNSDDHEGNIWIGMEFDKPIIIDKIKYLPRNDLNTIEVGDLYELFYWDNNWISLGQQRATKQYLEYQAPKGALMWLRNLSGGKEERPFTYENNKQIWW